MRVVSWSIAIVLGLLIVIFALSNRELAQWQLWPLAGTLDLPLFVPVLACAFVAFLLGGVVAWLSGASSRRLARRRGRRVAELEQQVRALEERLRASAEAPQAARPQPVLRQIPGGRA